MAGFFTITVQSGGYEKYPSGDLLPQKRSGEK